MLKKPIFNIYDGGVLIEISCKICGVVLAALADPEETGKMQLVRQTHYRELVIEHWLDHGRDQADRHVTTCCAQCAEKPISAEVLVEMYMADLDDMAREPGVEIPEAWKVRTPRKLLRVTKGGEV